jgi:beta-lactamase superfamily II metal-dependent hydrolase
MKTPRAAPRPRPAVRVRMYDVGFGDCFLVRIPTLGGDRKVLIDCGSIKAGRNPMKAVVKELVRDVTEGGTPRIDVVIATHRHRDHVSGFDDPLWKTVKVGEVWMPWTEDPDDPDATRIREAQAGLALQLRMSMAGADDPHDLAGVAMNALSNEDAMETLHEGFLGSPVRRFLPRPDAALASLECELLPGVRTFVIGPSRDPEVIRDMDPPAGKSFLRAQVAGAAGGPGSSVLSAWALSPGDFSTLHPELVLSGKDREAIRNLDAGWEMNAAAALDAAVNGTSLMIVFKVGRAHLLFPGDAQWGTWNAALKVPKWRELLGKTVFYKVGHHGSHNATPREFVESLLGRDFWAMASVNPTSRWPSIPREPLMDALSAKSKKVVRSDRPEDAPSTFTRSDFYLEATVPTT